MSKLKRKKIKMTASFQTRSGKSLPYLSMPLLEKSRTTGMWTWKNWTWESHWWKIWPTLLNQAGLPNLALTSLTVRLFLKQNSQISHLWRLKKALQRPTISTWTTLSLLAPNCLTSAQNGSIDSHGSQFSSKKVKKNYRVFTAMTTLFLWIPTSWNSFPTNVPTSRLNAATLLQFFSKKKETRSWRTKIL